MADETREDSQQPETPKFRDLYRYVNISVRTLDIIIISCILVIVVLLALDMRNPGFAITFNSKGGTDVPAHNQMYGGLLELPDPPTREGYEFSGWYRDYACDDLWNVETDTIVEDLTLYAGWTPKE